MIIRRTFLSLVSLLAAFGLSFEARSSELGSEYLLGKWVIDGNDCSGSSSEFVMFRKNGAVESVRAEKLEAAGFWEVSGETS